jgi:hypothetical protein
MTARVPSSCRLVNKLGTTSQVCGDHHQSRSISRRYLFLVLVRKKYGKVPLVTLIISQCIHIRTINSNWIHQLNFDFRQQCYYTIWSFYPLLLTRFASCWKLLTVSPWWENLLRRYKFVHIFQSDKFFVFFLLGGCICDDEHGDIFRFPTPTSHVTVSTQRADRERISLFTHQIILHPTTKRSPSPAEDNHHSLRAFTWIRFSHHHIVPPPKCFHEHPPSLKSSDSKSFNNNLHALVWKKEPHWKISLLPVAFEKTHIDCVLILLKTPMVFTTDMPSSPTEGRDY